MDEDVYQSIEKEAEKNGFTTSNLMSKIVKNYVTRDKFFEQLEFIPIGKDIIKIWLSRIEEEFLREDAKILGSTIARDYISYFFHDINISTLIKFLNIWLETLGNVQKKEHHNTCSFVINHCVNFQYSIYLQEFLTALIEPITKKRINFIEITPNLLSFSFDS
jgi:hypothetical protein